MKINSILISGGGTGGHIFPALSIAAELGRRHPEAKILFVGALGRMEMERVPAAGYEITGLPVAGFDRKHPWKNVAVLLKLWKSMAKARKIIKDFKPDIAIGVGGYASGPTLKAAQKAGIPTLLQEQNSFAGVTNRLLAKKAKAICTAYDGMERFFQNDNIVMTGNPVRKTLFETDITPEEAKKALGFDPSRPLILVIGGSLGARTINQAIAKNISSLIDGNMQILWQTGRYGEQIANEAAKGISDIKAMAFISDMATAYRAADLVVSRAGAGTISELQLLGKPTILIPSPNVAEDHQRHNAEALTANDAAVMILDSDAEQQLAKTVKNLINNRQRLIDLSQNILKMALTRSDEKIADEAERIVAENKK